MSEKKQKEKPGPKRNPDRVQLCFSLHKNTIAKIDRLKRERNATRSGVVTELVFYAKEKSGLK